MCHHSDIATHIKILSHLGLCSSDEVICHHNDIARLTIEMSTEGVPFPLHIVKEQVTTSAFDNFDHDKATLSGTSGSHDTVMFLFQDDSGKVAEKPKMSQTKVTLGPKTFHEELQCQNLQVYKSAKKADVPSTYKASQDPPSVCKALLTYVRVKDLAWELAKLDLDQDAFGIKSRNQTTPSWSASNSILTAYNLTEMCGCSSCHSPPSDKV